MFIVLLSVGGLLVPKCVSLNNRPYQARAKLADINSNEPIYYPFTVSVNKWLKLYY